jgi:AcrR family transcriptional regulator
VNVAGRAYSNTRRQQQAAETRGLILEALVRVLARGLAELSVPAIAEEAGVSVSTVYRNFPTKRDLLAGLGEYMDRRTGYLMEPEPRSPDDLAQTVRDAYRQADALEPEIQAAYASAVGQQMRHEREMPRKVALLSRALAPLSNKLDPDEQQHLLHLVMVLISRYTLHRYKVDLGVSADDAAETVAWALRTLTQAIAARPDGKSIGGST